jgi:methionyl aminopeptidase
VDDSLQASLAAEIKPPGRNDPCWCGSGRKYKKCHLGSDRAAAGRGRAEGRAAKGPKRPIQLKSREQIEGIRRAGRLTRDILDLVGARIGPGVTTEEIDRWVAAETAAHGATAASLGYRGFPKSICTSVNEVVCHGIPGPRALAAGDIVNVDVTTVLDGFYGDSSRMYLIGEVSPAARRLVEVTRECLDVGIAQVRPGGFVGDLGAAIQAHARAAGYSVVRNFGGHGIGLAFHEEPFVPHFGKAGSGPPLVAGMVFTIEPMINAGGFKVVVLDDGWTAVTKDGSLSAQWEHTVAVTAEGVDVLTV